MPRPRLVWGGIPVLCCFSALCQSPTAHIIGVVKDQTGGLVAGASVTVRHTATREDRVLASNESGEFTAANLRPVLQYPGSKGGIPQAGRARDHARDRPDGGSSSCFRLDPSRDRAGAGTVPLLNTGAPSRAT
jgi:hypothetical protein